MAASAAAASTGRSAASNGIGGGATRAPRASARFGEVAPTLPARGGGAEDIVSAEILALGLREGVGSLIFTGAFIVVAIAIGIWWLKRNA